MKFKHPIAFAMAAASLLAAPLLHAQEAAYPRQAVTLVVPFPAGGPTDAMARLLAQKLGDRLGQQVIIDNRGGAGGGIAAELVARAPGAATRCSSAPPARWRSTRASTPGCATTR